MSSWPRMRGGVRRWTVTALTLFGTPGLAWGASAAAAAAGGSPAEAEADEPVGSIVVAPFAPDAAYAQLYAAELWGLFDEHGVDVTIQLGGANTPSLVVAGRADLAFLGVNSALAPVLQGEETTVVYFNAGRGAAGVMAAGPDIESAADCGRVGSPGGLGTTSYGWAALYAEAFGADYDIVPMQSLTDVLASLQSGQIDCAVASAASFVPLLAEGDVHIVVEPRDPDNLPEIVRETPVIEGAVWGMRENLEEKRDAMERFMAAYDEARERLVDADPVELAELLREHSDFQAFELDDLATALENVEYTWAPMDGQISPETWAAQFAFFDLSGLDLGDHNDPRWSYDERIDMSFLDAVT